MSSRVLVSSCAQLAPKVNTKTLTVNTDAKAWRRPVRQSTLPPRNQPCPPSVIFPANSAQKHAVCPAATSRSHPFSSRKLRAWLLLALVLPCCPDCPSGRYQGAKGKTSCARAFSAMGLSWRHTTDRTRVAMSLLLTHCDFSLALTTVSFLPEQSAQAVITVATSMNHALACVAA